MSNCSPWLWRCTDVQRKARSWFHSHSVFQWGGNWIIWWINHPRRTFPWVSGTEWKGVEHCSSLCRDPKTHRFHLSWPANFGSSWCAKGVIFFSFQVFSCFSFYGMSREVKVIKWGPETQNVEYSSLHLCLHLKETHLPDLVGPLSPRGCGWQGKTCTAYPALKKHMMLFGANWEEPNPITKCFTDGNLVTGAAWPAHPEFIANFMALLGSSVKF